MASKWLVERLRESVAQLILRQRQDDAAPGTAGAQEASSDATYAEASCVHSTLTAYADEIELRLAALKVDVVLSQLADQMEKRDGRS